MSDRFRLSPCPFCGERLKLKLQEFTEDCYVQCSTCTTTGPNGFDAECAVIQWNNREENVQLRAQLAEAREVIEWKAAQELPLIGGKARDYLAKYPKGEK